MHRFSIVFLLFWLNLCQCKYLEGEIHTSDNWAFLARFCFLSEDGQFEYFLEFSDEQGNPNLLLYYDTDDQWPAVYKTNKNCYEKEAVLHVEQNQIINLTTTNRFYQELSGCTSKPSPLPTPKPKPSTTLLPKKATKSRKLRPTTTIKTTTIALPTPRTTPTTTEDVTTKFVEDFNYTTLDLKSQWEHIEITKAPIKKRAVRPPPTPQIRGNTIMCHNARKFRSARERWWFIALSNCNGTRGIHVKYKILMTNGPPGDYWHEHFSADEFYILPVLMAFSIAYSFLMLGIIVCSIELKSRQLLHTTYKIFVVSVIFQLFGIILTSAAYLKYAVNGLGPSPVKRGGAIFMGVSETLYMLLLLLLAKGFTITRGRLPLAASVKLTIFMCLYVVTYISIFIYEANVFDPGEVLYLYESPAGYGLIILRVLAWCMFVYSTVFTLKHYPEKSNFYYPFNVCGTMWFIAGPAFILSANSYIDKWIRESVVCAVLQFITFGGHLTFLILTMPSVANKNFPYHVRTTQIGIMELTGTSGSSTIQQFGHHVYEPSGTVRETVIVPLTRRTEEIFEGMYNQPVHNIRRESLNEDLSNTRNLMMENVINWSLARNIAALEMPNFERIERNSFVAEHSDNESVITSRRSSQPNGHFDDYVREVPIQLFTVSKMVTGNNDTPNGKTV
ncbi:transmembrane protein 145 isoform X1 [Tribolium castaneum]|uniref:Transmembrane protein 145-like Protein n=1 Tax=Tribolium castaneum TaxID=7070 RepID=D6WUH9_TRICA|nr:PREDICTED: transmembrane protein 145 isoform X1 [Tribolium castaneum]EFA08479.2 Transmembrane protein 145-like Protein [Tribolium castaneum]|eukprot:XP_008196154.1 PREDICTED: transmembrane protein 145 isoform X1 [Tribolium castaneum]